MCHFQHVSTEKNIQKSSLKIWNIFIVSACFGHVQIFGSPTCWIKSHFTPIECHLTCLDMLMDGSRLCIEGLVSGETWFFLFENGKVAWKSFHLGCYCKYSMFEDYGKFGIWGIGKNMPFSSKKRKVDLVPSLSLQAVPKKLISNFSPDFWPYNHMTRNGCWILANDNPPVVEHVKREEPLWQLKSLERHRPSMKSKTLDNRLVWRNL